MAIGQSGRIVIDTKNPATKSHLYKELKRQGKSMREWFLDKALADGLISEKQHSDELSAVKPLPKL